MWTDLPADVQGEILSKVTIHAWYALTKTCRRGWELFPSSSIRNMDFGRAPATYQQMVDVVADFDLPHLERVTLTGHASKHDAAAMRTIKLFLKAYPRARISSPSIIPCTDFFVYAFGGDMLPALRDWLDRYDTFNVSIAAHTALALCDEITSPRLLKGAFNLHLFSFVGGVEYCLNLYASKWRRVMDLASKVILRVQSDHAAPKDWCSHVLDYPVCAFDRPMLPGLYNPGHQSKGVAPKIGKKDTVLDAIVAMASKSPILICTDIESIAWFEQNEACFQNLNIMPRIAADVFAELQAHDWVRLFSRGWISDMIIYDLLYVFLFYLPAEWCTDPVTLDAIATLFARAMMTCNHMPPPNDVVRRFSQRRDPGRRVTLLMEKIRPWTLDAAAVHTAARAAAILSHLAPFEVAAPLSSFFKELKSPTYDV